MKNILLKQVSTRNILMSVLFLLALVLMQSFVVSADLMEKTGMKAASESQMSVQVTRQTGRKTIHTAIYNQFAVSTRY